MFNKSLILISFLLCSSYSIINAQTIDDVVTRTIEKN